MDEPYSLFCLREIIVRQIIRELWKDGTIKRGKSKQNKKEDK
jgi:hypothetical protein